MAIHSKTEVQQSQPLVIAKEGPKLKSNKGTSR